MYAIPAFLNDFNPANLSNPSSLQINSQPVAEGAGGRGEALEYTYSYNIFTHAMRTQGHILWLVVSVLEVRVGAVVMALQAPLLCARET